MKTLFNKKTHKKSNDLERDKKIKSQRRSFIFIRYVKNNSGRELFCSLNTDVYKRQAIHGSHYYYYM